MDLRTQDALEEPVVRFTQSPSGEYATPQYSRAQGALEYLMTHGWAILVVMVVGGVLWQWGFLVGDSGISSVGFTYFRFLASASSSSGGATVLSFINALPERVFFLEDSEVVNLESGDVCEPFISPLSVESGGVFTVETDCLPSSSGSLEVRFFFATNYGGVNMQRKDTGRINIRNPTAPPENTNPTIDCPTNKVCGSQCCGDNEACFFEGETSYCSDINCVTGVCADPDRCAYYYPTGGARLCCDPNTYACFSTEVTYGSGVWREHATCCSPDQNCIRYSHSSECV
jgi:hypothetical protein